MGDTGLELASGGQVRPNTPILLGFGALRSAQVRSNCYQNCHQALGRARLRRDSQTTGSLSASWIMFTAIAVPLHAHRPGIDLNRLGDVSGWCPPAGKGK